MFKSALFLLLSLAFAALVYSDCAVTLVSTTKAVTCARTSTTLCLAAQTNDVLATTCPFTQNVVIGSTTDSHLHVCNSDAALALGRTALTTAGFTCKDPVTVDTRQPVQICGTTFN
jgi:hypothetical protein